ncbi:hypothetical protein GGS24DRAFT_443568 [Hypoxylon argillaceum]|nr:hypothetical protein GGS24DRAFT_443568 [Hypoxylon argillaceum]
MPIRPVVIFDPVKGRCHPDPHYFPKHADEFYALREMDNVRKRQQLIYLTEFYELVPPNSDYIVDNSFDTIARLETVLGLEEGRFIRFRERAQKYAYRSSEYSIKRTHNEYSELGQHLMPLIEALANEGKPSSPSVYTRVGWDTNPSPANKRPRIPLAPTGSAVATAAAAPTPAELDDLDAPTSAQPRLLSESTSAPPTDPEAPAELMSLPSTLPDRGSTTNPNTSVRASSDGRTSP